MGRRAEPQGLVECSHGGLADREESLDIVDTPNHRICLMDGASVFITTIAGLGYSRCSRRCWHL